MGEKVSKFCNPFELNKRYVLVVGAEGSGKTTFLYGPRLKPGWEQTTFRQTIGYNYEEIRMNSGVMGIFDTPGNESLFPIVRNLYKNLRVAGVVFVMKLSDKSEEIAIDFIMAKRKIKFLANEPELKKCVFAIVGNVQGEIDAQFKNKDYIDTALGIKDLKHIPDTCVEVFDAKYSPKEGERVWRWISEKINFDDD
jgi:GTPase SAR1 family protein